MVGDYLISTELDARSAANGHTWRHNRFRLVASSVTSQRFLGAFPRANSTEIALCTLRLWGVEAMLSLVFVKDLDVS